MVEISLSSPAKDSAVSDVGGAEKSAEERHRRKFLLIKTWGGAHLSHPRLDRGGMGVFDGDIDTLASLGLLAVTCGGMRVGAPCSWTMITMSAIDRALHT